eukprot:m.180452 g.180452  ORF g.180452 m.180452 type:complete len:968 (-) comp15007_c0_seq1:43-2946(-)
MEAFAEAVAIHLGVGYSEAQKVAALAYIEEVKSSGEGWIGCAEGFSSDKYPTDVRFLCLVVLEQTVSQRYGQLEAEQQQWLKELVLDWMGRAGREPASIRNKAAQFLIQIFVHEFPERWPSFFDDVLSLLDTSTPATFDFFFRMLKTIDELVVDRGMSRSPDELARNTHIKDAMRLGPNTKIAEAWDHCLRNMAESSPDVVALGLETIALYISWIDLNLVVNESSMTLLFDLCRTNQDLRALSCACLKAVVLKGMDGNSKTELIEQLELVAFIEEQFSNLEGDDENEYSIALASLVNAMGSQLAEAVTQLVDSEQDPARAMSLMYRVFDTALVIMQSEYDDISQEIVPLAHLYLVHARSQPVPDEARLTKLLETVIAKMRYDNDFNYDNQGDDEAEFLEFRDNLKVVFTYVGQVVPQVFLQTCATFVESTLTDLAGKLESGALNFADVELALHVVYLLGETFSAPREGEESSEASQEMGRLMLLASEGTFQLVGSNCVNLKFFSMCVRLGSFFSTRPDRLPALLDVFLGNGGLGSTSAHVRSRSCYLLLRFVRDHGRRLLAPYLGDIVSMLQPQLEYNNNLFDLDDQRSMVEIIGQIATSDAVSGADQRLVLEPLFAMLVGKVVEIQTEHIPAATSAEEMLELANALRYFITLTTSATKGLGSPRKVAESGLDEVLLRALEVYLRVLQIPIHKETVHTAVRVFVHRMIVCLGAHVLPLMPEALGSMLGSDSVSVEDLMQVIPLANQVIVKFKTKAAPLLDGIFLPVARATFAILRTHVDPADLCTHEDHKVLRQSYFEFLESMVTHRLAHVLTSEENAPHVGEILSATLEVGNPLDTKGQRVLFGMFRGLIKQWFMQGSGLEGFDEFVLSNVIPSCFQTIMTPGVELDDAWSQFMVGEVAAVLLTTFDAAGPSFLSYLQDTYFPDVGLPAAAGALIIDHIQQESRPARERKLVLRGELINIAKALRS